jgi:hypothetical protein
VAYHQGGQHQGRVTQTANAWARYSSAHGLRFAALAVRTGRQCLCYSPTRWTTGSLWRGLVILGPQERQGCPCPPPLLRSRHRRSAPPVVTPYQPDWPAQRRPSCRRPSRYDAAGLIGSCAAGDRAGEEKPRDRRASGASLMLTNHKQTGRGPALSRAAEVRRRLAVGAAKVRLPAHPPPPHAWARRGPPRPAFPS